MPDDGEIHDFDRGMRAPALSGMVSIRHSELEKLVQAVKERDALRASLEWAFPAQEGFTEAFDGLVERGLLIEVPADDEYRAEWDSDTMHTWSWRTPPPETED